MRVTLPDNADTITPENTTDVRCAVRSKAGSGFLFLNSYQDHVEMSDLDGLRFELHINDGAITLPRSQTLSLKKNVSAILPFGLTLAGIRLRSATTQLLAQLADDAAITYVSFAPRGMISEYVFATASYESLHVDHGAAVEADGETVVTVTPGWTP